MNADGRLSNEVPRISVIIPAFNVADWIGLTLESILGQSERQLEVIVVDDGSSDDTVGAVEAFSASDSRVRALRNPTKGGAAARNYGVSLAAGEFLAFADGDDYVPERAYERLLAQADASGNDMVIGNHITMEPQRLVSRSRSLPIYDRVRAGITLVDEPKFLRDRVCWNRIIRRSRWIEHDLSFSEARRSNDIQAMTKAYALIPFDVIPEPVYAYRRRVGSSSMTSNKLKPGPLRDHFEQELGCADVVDTLQNKRLRDEYFAGILQFDVWAHGKIAVERGDEEFEPVRELLVEIVTRASRDAVRNLPPHHQLVYDAVARRDWEAATIAVSQQGLTMVEALRGSDARAIVRGALRTDRYASHAAAWLVRASYFKAIIDDPNSFSDDELIELHAELRELIAVGIPKFAFNWREQQIALANAGSADSIREAAQKPEPRGVQQFVLRARRKIAQIAGTSAGDTRSLRLRDVLGVLRRIRPRHVKRAAAAVKRRASASLRR